MKPKILVVEDEPDAMELIAFNLQAADFTVLKATNGKQAIEKAQSALPNLIVLDVMLPQVNGLEVCKVLRHHHATARIPILMLTAKAEEIDRVLGLELGADDYVVKPFSPRELILRIKALLRRSQSIEETAETLSIGEMSIDIPKHRVLYRGKTVSELTAKEFKLLLLLAQRRGRVQSRERLLQDVWEYEAEIDTRTVDTHVGRLRDKLGPAARYIETVRGVGYRMLDA